MKTALLFVLFPLAAAPTPPRPDIIPEGMRHIEFVLLFDAARFSGSLCRAYEIVSGDTFDGIAKREYGDVKCSEEIRLLNPSVTPEKLKPGTKITIPPRMERAESRGASRPSDDERAAWVLFQAHGGPGRDQPPMPILENEPLESVRWTLTVVAVPRSRLLSFLAIDWRKVDRSKPLEGVIQSDPVRAEHYVRDADRTMKIERRLTLEGIKDGRLQLGASEKRFDKHGKLMSEKDGNQNGGTRKADMLPLAAIGAIGLIGVLGLARRRRAKPGCCR